MKNQEADSAVVGARRTVHAPAENAHEPALPEAAAPLRPSPHAEATPAGKHETVNADPPTRPPLSPPAES